MARHDRSDSDEPLRPDEVTNESASGRNDLDRLAERAVDAVLHLVRRANALAGGVLMFAVVTSIGGFLLGLAALSDGMKTLWTVVGGFFVIVAVGTVVTAMLRLRSVRKSAGSLVGEVRSLLGSDRAHVNTVTATVSSSEDKADGSIVELSKEFFTMKGSIGDRAGQFRQLASALGAVTSFPGLIAIAALVSFGFLFLALIFLLALAL